MGCVRFLRACVPALRLLFQQVVDFIEKLPLARGVCSLFCMLRLLFL